MKLSQAILENIRTTRPLQNGSFLEQDDRHIYACPLGCAMLSEGMSVDAHRFDDLESAYPILRHQLTAQDLEGLPSHVQSRLGNIDFETLADLIFCLNDNEHWHRAQIARLVARFEVQYENRAKYTSPLRYPGGKSRLIKHLLPLFPVDCTDYREPFVGGGSVFLATRSRYGDIRYTISDTNAHLIYFWQAVQNYTDALMTGIRDYKTAFDGHLLFMILKSLTGKDHSPMFKAIRFFILNRITFSGLTETGGFSQAAFETRFTENAIDRLQATKQALAGVSVKWQSYEQAFHDLTPQTFFFLDPPYPTAHPNKLYGEQSIFDQEALANFLKKQTVKWLLTLPDLPLVRTLYAFADIHKVEVAYGMNNYKQGHALRGHEVIIKNY